MDKLFCLGPGIEANTCSSFAEGLGSVFAIAVTFIVGILLLWAVLVTLVRSFWAWPQNWESWDLDKRIIASRLDLLTTPEFKSAVAALANAEYAPLSRLREAAAPRTASIPKASEAAKYVLPENAETIDIYDDNLKRYHGLFIPFTDAGNNVKL